MNKQHKHDHAEYYLSQSWCDHLSCCIKHINKLVTQVCRIRRSRMHFVRLVEWSSCAIWAAVVRHSGMKARLQRGLMLLRLVELTHEQNSTWTQERETLDAPNRRSTWSAPLNAIGGKKKWDFKLNATRALPVLLCWMRKRKGRSRVISSTAMRENITAAKRGGEMDKQVSVSAKFSCNLKFWTQTTLCAIQVLSKIIKVSLFFTPQGHQCCIYHCLHYSEQLICFYFILIVPCSINALKLHFLWLSVLYFFTFECWGWVKTNMVPLLILTFQTCILSGVSGLGLQLCLKHNSVLLQLCSFFFWCCSGHRCVSW